MARMPPRGTLPRLITDDVLWTGGCMAASVDGMLAHYSCFVVRGARHSLLVDTGHPAHRAQVTRDVLAFLDGRPLDYVFPTHAELPHAGLLPHWLALFPQAQAVGDMRDWHLYQPDLAPRFREMQPGDALDLGDREFRFLAPIWRDLPDTLWGFDTQDRVLFLSDACACFHPHTPGQSDHFTSEVAPPSVPLMQDFNDKALHWPRYTDSTASADAMQALLERLDPAYLAGSHGAVVDDWRRMLPVFKAGMGVAA
jgi:flavorubredoxin